MKLYFEKDGLKGLVSSYVKSKYWDLDKDYRQIDENALIEFARQEFFNDCKKNNLNITE